MLNKKYENEKTLYRLLSLCCKPKKQRVREKNKKRLVKQMDAISYSEILAELNNKIKRPAPKIRRRLKRIWKMQKTN